MKRYVLALDQGTTSSRAILLEKNLAIAGIAQRELRQHYTPEGYIEHDPMEIYAGQYAVMMELLAQTGVEPGQIASIGIANQRETTILWDKATGKPVYPAIVWQCRRTTPIVNGLLRDGYGEHIRSHTGLVPDGYFSATKIKWILDHEPGLRERAAQGEVLFGTVDTWLLWNLTGGRVHATDYTNASRTMLYDINKLCWDETLLRALDIPSQLLPQVYPSSAVYGSVNIQGVQVPLGGVAGDQQAALFGQCCFEEGQAKNTYGTGCFLLMNTGRKACASQNGLLTTIAASLPGEIQYALEGNVFIGGAVIQWLRDGVRFLSESADAEYHAQKVKDSGGVYFVPAFTGLGAPYWDPYARGMLIGLGRDTNRNHIIRAAQESIAFQSADLVRAMERDTGLPLLDLRVDGGASRDRFLMQFQADILDQTVRRPATPEATALGCAFLAGLSSGFWGGLEEIRSLWQPGMVFTPCMEPAVRGQLLNGWQRAVKRCSGWLEPNPQPEEGLGNG